MPICQLTFEGLGRLLAHATKLEAIYLDFFSRLVPAVYYSMAHIPELSILTAFQKTKWYAYRVSIPVPGVE